MFSNNKEFFDFIRLLIDKLDTVGERQWSSSLKRAMSLSQVPGEVLGELKIILRKFQTTDIPAKLNIVEEVNSALDSLEKAFKQ